MTSQLKPPPQRSDEPRREGQLARATWIEVGLVTLSLIWLLLIGLEFVYGERPGLSAAIYSIWAIFVVDFLARLLMAPDKLDYLRANSLTALSLLLPALRVFRLLRLVRLSRITRLFKVLGSMNRAFRALGRTLANRGMPYVALLTTIIVLLGAAGFYAFEKPPHGSLDSYPDALWCVAMIMTTMGSDYWPVSPEGRILYFILALYAIAVFGYFTAALASFLIGTRTQDDEIASTLRQLNERLQELEMTNKGTRNADE